MIECKECGYTHEYFLSANHLKSHGLSIKDYKTKYAGAMVRQQTSTARTKMSAAKIGKASSLLGRSKTYEHKQNIKNSMLDKYSAGEIVHWNTGKTTSIETKQKISISNKAAFNIGNARQQEKKYQRMRAGAESYGCEIINIDEASSRASAKCLTCDHEFTFTHQVFYPTRLSATNKLCPICNPRETFSSRGEKELASFISSLGIRIVRNDREVLGGLELDVYIPSKKIAFEYTGLYWHAEKQNTNKKHLLHKHQFAHKCGVKLITIFEDEWLLKQDIVKSRIMAILGVNDNRIFARKLTLKEVSSKDSNAFLNLYHIQGQDIAAVRIGLYSGETLLQLATFKKTNKVKGGDGSKWELSRLCGKAGMIIVGGASKLIKRFMDDHTGVELISYADRRWSTGEVYEKIGFVFAGESAPSYWYLDKRYTQRKHRSNYMKHTLPKHFGVDIDMNKSEWEIMQEAGLDRIWDCGTTKWTLK